MGIRSDQPNIGNQIALNSYINTYGIKTYQICGIQNRCFFFTPLVGCKRRVFGHTESYCFLSSFQAEVDSSPAADIFETLIWCDGLILGHATNGHADLRSSREPLGSLYPSTNTYISVHGLRQSDSTTHNTVYAKRNKQITANSLLGDESAVPTISQSTSALCSSDNSAGSFFAFQTCAG